MRHATDPDHVIAVSTIVSRQNKIGRAALTGIFWGVGHTLTIIGVGAAIILFGLVIPARIGLSMELSVGLMLVLLGAMNVSAFLRSARAVDRGKAGARVEIHHHAHGDYIHSHAHGKDSAPHPHSPEKTPLARMDTILGGVGIYRVLRPLLVGVVHGLAGSAAVALLVLTTIHEPRWAVAYLLVFGLGTVAGMMLITMSIASAFTFFGRRYPNFTPQLALASGLISLAFGLVVIYQICFSGGLFTGHANWTPR